MASRSRVIGIALVAVAAALPGYSGAQVPTPQNINGLQVWVRSGPGWEQRGVKVEYGWYWETTYYDANRLIIGMEFQTPRWQLSDRVDRVADTNGDHVMDYGWELVVPTGYVPWNPTEIGSYRTLANEERTKYNGALGTPLAELYRMYIVRADKMMEAAGQMIRARSP